MSDDDDDTDIEQETEDALQCTAEGPEDEEKEEKEDGDNDNNETASNQSPLDIVEKTPTGTGSAVGGSKKKRRRDADPVGTAISKYLDSKRQRKQPEACDERDEDASFMLSFVPVLKRLPCQQRALAKVKIAALMCEMEFGSGVHIHQPSTASSFSGYSSGLPESRSSENVSSGAGLVYQQPQVTDRYEDYTLWNM